MISFAVFLENEKLDLFDDETVFLKDSIQNARDIKKIFTEYVKQFNIPATPNNNRIFKHFYNYEIVDGFDARKRPKATIKIYGIDYKRGYLQLNSVSMKYGKANLYKVFFTGETSKIKDIVRDDKLSDLYTLDRLNHDYSITENIQTGFQNFCRVDVQGSGNSEERFLVPDNDGEICYPFLTHTKRYTYTQQNGIRNVNQDNTIGNEALDLSQLKPAIKIKSIVEAIAEQYGFIFKSDFFNTFEFLNLFMWMHRDQGQMTSESKKTAVFQTTKYVAGQNEDGIFEIVGGDPSNDLATIDGIYTINNLPFSESEITFKYELFFNADGLVSYELIDDLTGNVLNSSENAEVLAGEDLVVLYTLNNVGSVKPTLKISTQSINITELQIDLEIFTPNFFNSYRLKDTIYNFDVSRIVIRDQIPSMKVVDFLTSIFKLYNLTAEVNVDDEIEIQPLDDYYENGDIKDITNQIDVKSSEVERVEPFSRINFTYEDASTFLAKKRNNLTDKVFGDLTQDLSDQLEQGKAYTGGDYTIDVGFEKMLFERLVDDNENLTTVSFGWFVDEKQEPTVGKPLIFFCKGQGTSFYPIDFETGGSTNLYIRPSNTEFLGRSLNFGAEIDEFTLNVAQGSLFKRFYRDYILRVFNKQSRILKINAKLPLKLALNLKLNDTLIIDNKQYLINELNIKLNDLSANLELINRADLLPEIANLTPVESPFVETVNTDKTINSINVTFDRPIVTDEDNTTFEATIIREGNPIETKVVAYDDPSEVTFTNLANILYEIIIVTNENGRKSDIRLGANRIFVDMNI